MQAGDLLAGRYRLDDLLTESGDGRFWRAHDQILQRPVGVHLIAADDERAESLMAAARRSAGVVEPRILRVLDADLTSSICYVVNEWGEGTSLDRMLASLGPMAARPSAWLVAEVADAIATAHAAGVAHGRLVPENVLVDADGGVHLIGCCVEGALHGLSEGTAEEDVAAIGALLHACLTATWPGTGVSAVTPTPTEHGRPLRPRQVRPGVPRVLDDLVGELLGDGRGRRGEHPDARSVQRTLADVVGDPTGLGEAIAAGSAAVGPLPRHEARDTTPDTEADAETRPDPPRTEDVPTQAGLPAFDDDSEPDEPHLVDPDWHRPRTDPVPPPPPLEEPPPRPLFAPDPPEGSPSRDPRRASTVLADDTPTGQFAMSGEFWPWNPTSTSTGSTPAYDDRSGRTWLRLAGIVAIVLLLVAAVAIAYNLGRGRGPLGGTDPSPSPTTSAPSELSAYSGITPQQFDPPPGDGEENAEELALATDGDPGTAWTTQTYDQQLGPGGLKMGVGMLLDLGQSRAVERVDVRFGAGQHSAEIFVLDDAPTAAPADAGLTPAAEITGSGLLEAVPGGDVRGRYVLIWLTELGPADSRFRGEIVDVKVLGPAG